MSQSPQRQRRRKVRHAHKLVWATAVEMAGALYEEMMRDNFWYESWKVRNPGIVGEQLQLRFVAKIAPTLLPDARATLATMLARPDIADDQKTAIHEALLLDRQLPKGQQVLLG